MSRVPAELIYQSATDCMSKEERKQNRKMSKSKWIDFVHVSVIRHSPTPFPMLLENAERKSLNTLRTKNYSNADRERSGKSEWANNSRTMWTLNFTHPMRTKQLHDSARIFVSFFPFRYVHARSHTHTSLCGSLIVRLHALGWRSKRIQQNRKKKQQKKNSFIACILHLHQFNRHSHAGKAVPDAAAPVHGKKQNEMNMTQTKCECNNNHDDDGGSTAIKCIIRITAARTRWNNTLWIN